MIDESKVNKFVRVMNDLVDLEASPPRGSGTGSYLHDERRMIWGSMTDEEKQLARKMLGDRARWC